MKPALVTLLPMLLAAGLVLLGGGRLAQREVEERAAVDRDRLVDFASSFGTKLERLERRYLEHLERLANQFVRGQSAPVEDARDIIAVEAMHLFTSSFPSTTAPRKDEFAVPRPDRTARRLPEVEIEGGKRPLNSRRAVVLPAALLETEPEGRSGWIEAPDGLHRVFWSRPGPMRLVAIVVHTEHLRAATDAHLQTWLQLPFTPLRESGELVSIDRTGGPPLVVSDDPQRGPAALLMPFRNALGAWQINAWDRVTVTNTYHNATLALAATVSAILAIGGILLYVQQRRAVRLAEERVSFVNRVSHELGTPLTNLSLNVDLATEAVGDASPEARHRLQILTEEIERLGRLVANVLTFSRRERRNLEVSPKPCVPDEVIARMIDSFRPAFLRRGIEIDWISGAKGRVRLDPDALGQITGNLISNVEKYAASGEWIRIESRLADETLSLRVSDRGPGIEAEARQRIFKPFERVHRKVNEGASGTGLGLAIARELAHRLGGSLELLDVRAGASFELQVPAPAVLTVVSEKENPAA